MPDDTLPTPDTARRYTKTLADLYGEATTTLLRAIADRMARGLDDTAQRSKLGDVLELREQARRVAAQVSGMLDERLADTIGQAYDHGVGQGADHLSSLLGLRDADAERAARAGLTATKRSTVEALARGLGDQLRDLPMIRAAEDAYRDATLAAIVPSTAGVEVRRNATQRALDRLAMQGIGGFTDRSGRRWRLESYAEMATRTTVAHASLQGSVDRIRQTTPFVRVSDVSDECEKCRRWEGKTLLTVDADDIPAEWADTSYDGTLREATSAGLFHPNCTHSLGAFVPGLTRDSAQRPASSNPQGYADRQRQRALERNVRAWKRREAVAITPQAKALASSKVSTWQAALREHVDATNRPRRYDRESIFRRRLPGDGFDPADLPNMPDSPSGPSLAREFAVDAPKSAGSVPREALLTDLDDDVLEAELADLMAREDYGPRFEAIGNELDRRATAPPAPSLPDVPDPIAEQHALDRLLWGDGPSEATIKRRTAGRVDPEKELRDEYDTWVHTQWLRAEEETRGNLLSKAGTVAFSRGEFEVLDLFTRRRRSLEFASEELQRWFAEPGNARMSYPEFRAGRMDDKKARQANARRRNRGFESEHG